MVASIDAVVLPVTGITSPAATPAGQRFSYIPTAPEHARPPSIGPPASRIS